MNNKNKILVGCLALLLALSVGYALFSETITINGTATAKGNFDISYTCELLTSTNAITDEAVQEMFTKGGTGTCVINGQTLTTTSNLTKPTDRVTYRVKLTNSGSIPAILKTVDSSNNYNGETSGPGDAIYIDENTSLAAMFVLVKFNADGTGDWDNGYSSDSTAEAANITLQPGESINVYVHNLWLDVENQPAVPQAGATINYSVTLGFEQITVQ